MFKKLMNSKRDDIETKLESIKYVIREYHCLGNYDKFCIKYEIEKLLADLAILSRCAIRQHLQELATLIAKINDDILICLIRGV